MIKGKRYQTIVGILAIIGLIALLGGNLFRVFTVIIAVLLFYTGAELLRQQSSRFMIVAGIASIILGSFVLTGWFSIYLGVAIIIVAGIILLKLSKDKKEKSKFE